MLYADDLILIAGNRFKKSRWINYVYWWFAYDVIKNMIMQIMINLLQILMWTIRPYDMSLYQIWSYLNERTQSYRPIKLENFCYIMWENGAGHSFADYDGCRLATSLFPDNTKWIKLRLKMKNQEEEKLEEEGNRLVTLECSWILLRMDSTYDLGLQSLLLCQ